MKTPWDSLNPGDRLEIGLIQVDISGHSLLSGSDLDLKRAKDILRDSLELVVSRRGGRTLNWAGDGGSFMFQTAIEQGYDNLCFATIQMLAMVPIVNAEIEAFTDLESTIRVRFSCDAGLVTYDPDPARISGGFLNAFLNHEREVGLANVVTITDRVHRQIRRRLRDQFAPHRRSPELDCELFEYKGSIGEQEFLLSNLRRIHFRSFLEKDDIYSTARSIDLVGISLHGFTPIAREVRSAILGQGAKLRVALLDPRSDAFAMVDRYTPHYGKGVMAAEARKAVREIRDLQSEIRRKCQVPVSGRSPESNIELYWYDNLTHSGIAITDEVIRYWPYLCHTRLDDTPSFDILRQSVLARYYVEHFENVIRGLEPVDLDVIDESSLC